MMKRKTNKILKTNIESIFDEIIKDRKNHIPKTGFNVCSYDDFDLPREQIYTINWFETKIQAKEYIDSQKDNKLFIISYEEKEKVEKKLLKKAINFAKNKHKGQFDDSGKDYFTAHCNEVYKIISLVAPKDNNLLIASLLHDTIEDTNTSYEEIKNEFNEDVANLVMEVTHEEYFDKNHNKLGAGFPQLHSKRGIILKFADKLNNLSRMSVWNESKQKQYLKKSNFWYNNLFEKKLKDELNKKKIT